MTENFYHFIGYKVNIYSPVSNKIISLCELKKHNEAMILVNQFLKRDNPNFYKLYYDRRNIKRAMKDTLGGHEDFDLFRKYYPNMKGAQFEALVMDNIFKDCEYDWWW